MLQVHGLGKSYGVKNVLSNVSVIVDAGEHVGLVGANGTGKSTLLRCIAGVERPDTGTSVLTPPGATVGYLPQSFDHLNHRTVGEVIAAAQTEWTDALKALERATEVLATSANVDAALADYDSALARFEALGGYELEQQTTAILHGLGLGDLDRATRVVALSGGQKTRLGLAALLVQAPSLLLLDEPTNHLDVDGLQWLEGFIRGYPGTVLIVSHDREFLDQTVTRILYLDPDERTVRSYVGNYSQFVAARRHEQALHREAWKQQEAYVDRVKRDIARLKSEALAIERGTTPRQPGVRKLARKKAQVAKARERKLERFLDSDDRVEKPRLGWGLKIDFGPPPAGGRDVLRLEDVTAAYPGRPPVIREASLAVRFGERVAVVGPNGAGKTTLLRLIDGRLQPYLGRVRLGANVRLGTLSQACETLDRDQTVLEAALAERPMSETDARSFLHFFLFAGDSVLRRIGDCSLGEQKRLQLALLVLRGCNLLLLDEPLNHLDIEGREHFAAALDAFEGTVIAVVHDRAFLRAFAERTVEVRDGRVRVFEGGYDEYVRQITRSHEATDQGGRA